MKENINFDYYSQLLTIKKDSEGVQINIWRKLEEGVELVLFYNSAEEEPLQIMGNHKQIDIPVEIPKDEWYELPEDH